MIYQMKRAIDNTMCDIKYSFILQSFAQKWIQLKVNFRISFD